MVLGTWSSKQRDKLCCLTGPHSHNIQQYIHTQYWIAFVCLNLAQLYWSYRCSLDMKGFPTTWSHPPSLPSFLGWPFLSPGYPPERPPDAGGNPQTFEGGEADSGVSHSQAAVPPPRWLGERRTFAPPLSIRSAPAVSGYLCQLGPPRPHLVKRVLIDGWGNPLYSEPFTRFCFR